MIADEDLDRTESLLGLLERHRAAFGSSEVCHGVVDAERGELLLRARDAHHARTSRGQVLDGRASDSPARTRHERDPPFDSSHLRIPPSAPGGDSRRSTARYAR